MFLAFLEHTEPLWLFILLSGEMWLSYQIWKMAKIEFQYDKEWNERVAARRQRMSKPKEKPVPYEKEMD